MLLHSLLILHSCPGDKIWINDATTIDGVSGETYFRFISTRKRSNVFDYGYVLRIYSGSIGETSTIAILIGAFILIATELVVGKLWFLE